MQQIFDLLAKGNYRGIALFLIIAFSGAGAKLMAGREKMLVHMGEDASTAEFVVATISITLNFMILIALVLTLVVVILQDAGIDVIPARFKVQKEK